MVCHYAHEKHKMDCYIHEELDFEIEIQNPNISKNSNAKQPLLCVNKNSNRMQQYADSYLLQSYSTCSGCHSTHHQEY